ncbi:MAG: hypothetical protein OES79_14605, partial [Planctomycetota bacterium]|nr:hypothetical protein [Planctomycetota bacterium]
WITPLDTSTAPCTIPYMNATQTTNGGTKMKIETIKTSNGLVSVQEALELLSEAKPLNNNFSQVVIGIYEDGTETCLQGRRDGLYYLSGNFCSDAS